MPKRVGTFHVSAFIIPSTFHWSKWFMAKMNINGAEEYPPHLEVGEIGNVGRT